MDNQEETRLTGFTHGGGCGCKIAPAVLQEMLAGCQQAPTAGQLLVGNSSNDDAAVYDLQNGQALIATTDFFTPIVDDAFSFGQIAAANAISDVYAMGGKPILAIAILGWPVDKLAPSIAAKVLDGARNICAAAGIPLAGGHSISTAEPIFGLAVNGLVQIEHLKKNNTALAGDVLFLTRPLGVGILTTAQKRGVLQPAHLDALMQQMTRLNKVGALLGSINGVHAMTDVTGFGLLGHLVEMATGSGLSAELDYSRIPILPAAREYLSQRIVPDATYRNWNSYSASVAFAPGVNVMEAFNTLPDPQTNGGLLIAADAGSAPAIMQILQENDCYAQPIGVMTSPQEKTILVKP